LTEAGSVYQTQQMHAVCKLKLDDSIEVH